MIFIANVLVMNGGTTFLIRTCRTLSARGQSCVVLLLRPQFDPQLREELERHARVVLLQDLLRERGMVFRAHLGVFGWVDWSTLGKALQAPQSQVHAMGVFGLLFALRMAQHGLVDRVTVGVYHQNEFLFRSPPFYFPREAIRQFAALPAENVVFFNGATRQNYERFFGTSYADATIIPIGIELPAEAAISQPSSPPRIVSVGNLVNFKTYNRHIIELMSSLTERHPDLVYEIYGEGPERGDLQSLANALALGKHVVFKGAIPYREFQGAIAGAVLFVGSGTALIEAAAAGIPALIGIESIKTPDTYGFLSDIEGLTYNEDIPGQAKQSIRPLVAKIIADAEYRHLVAVACKRKSAVFSVGTTADGLMALNSRARCSSGSGLGTLRLFRMMFSLLALALYERLGGATAFSNRRDQSF